MWTTECVLYRTYPYLDRYTKAQVASCVRVLVGFQRYTPVLCCFVLTLRVLCVWACVVWSNLCLVTTVVKVLCDVIVRFVQATCINVYGLYYECTHRHRFYISTPMCFPVTCRKHWYIMAHCIQRYTVCCTPIGVERSVNLLFDVLSFIFESKINSCDQRTI